MSTADAKIEKWKNKLLDMGKRNKLISYKDTKSSSLRFQQPHIFEFWDNFVVKENPIIFPYIEDEEKEENEEEIIENINTSIITNKTIKEQQRTLRRLRDRAKTSIEEQGVNILYLSFGFLKWKESDSSKFELLSPLILVPVSLAVESIASPYIMSLHEDEIVINPTLRYKLEADFGIKLNDFDLTENNLQDYLKELEEMFSANKWEIVYDVALSLFSFLKINMYNDIEKHKDSIKQHPVIRALMGDTSTLNKDTKNVENIDFDTTIKPIDTFQVVDADSSQQEAIVNAKNGVSFVLQGPPGTGKSQTITNIIAESIAEGKKVLFVSEKMAALDVVYKRLSDAELQDFCLIMHSHRANKKAILEQLGNVLSLSRKQANIKDEAFQKIELLQENKNKLNEYSKSIFKVNEPLNKTIYEIDGEIANLDEYDDVIFKIENILEITPEKLNRCIYLLGQLTNTLGKMSGDYKLNPWVNSNIKNISNELRHDINSRITKLIGKLNNFTKIYEKNISKIGLEYGTSYNDLFNTLQLLECAKESPIVPIKWTEVDNIDKLIDEAEETLNKVEKCRGLQNKIKQIYSTFTNEKISESMLLEKEELNTIEEDLANLIVHNNVFFNWNKLEIDDIEKSKKKLDEILAEYNEIKEKLLIEFENEIFQIDYKSIYTRYKTDYSSPFKIFNKQYKEDLRQIKACSKEIINKLKDEHIIEILSSLKRMQELKDWLTENESQLSSIFGEMFYKENTNKETISCQLVTFKNIKECLQYVEEDIALTAEINEKDLILKEYFEFLYKGINTDWKNIIDSLKWTKEFKRLVEKYEINKQFINNICSNNSIVEECNNCIKVVAEYLTDIKEEYEWFLDLFDDKETINDTNIYKLTDRLENCKNNLSKLEEWIDLKNCREECFKEGLEDYINEIDKLDIETKNIIPIFKKRFYRLYLDTILPQYPVVMNFRRINQEETIKEFAELDKLQFDIAKSRIKKRLIDSLPEFDRFSMGNDELSILKRELGKQRRIMPIRKLFKQIPNLVLTLKPCLMMSPLTVSMFLDSDIYKFDLVIFDEASQVCTENAIGAISRGKQVIIAGDSKQLPPTNFFTATTSDVDYDTSIDEDKYDDEDAYESVLDEAVLLPEKTLLWHYRSRHEHLIAFSNVKIYRNNLITFPSNVDRTPDNGVEYIYVKEGIYDRGGRKGNVIEAKRVAELVFEHFKRFPNRSLGVITFGEIQQQAIENEVRQMRIKHQEFETFFKEDNKEPFFIKNLENVQGDERDTIIFSIGYAKDATGKMQMIFGPLSQAGGERRLNVAITRAKYNVKLIGSIMPTDIEIERITAEGPKLLRSYIDFAIHGVDSILSEVTENDYTNFDSPFEEAVYNFLDRKGYRVVTQVGCSGYRIDMAIKHPTLSGRYIIGIECDGAAYHSARTARERDRLRQDVLEQMGWKIYRIWSTDWIKDSITEGERLINAIEDALKNYQTDELNINNNTIQKKTDFLEIANKKISEEERLNPYGFEKYRFTNLESIYRTYNDNEYLKDIILAIVNNEYPIHFEFICRKVAYLFGNEKVTVKVRRSVQFIINSRMKGLIYENNNFYVPVGKKEVVPKIMSERPIDFISKEELAEAMFIITNKSVGLTKETLLLETAKIYGFTHRGANIKAALENGYEYLLNSGRIKEIDEKITVK